MSSPVTTMASLMDAISILVGNSLPNDEWLAKVRTVKSGLLPIATLYPAITVLPKSMTVTSRLSGRGLRLSYALEIYTYVAHLNSKTARELMLEISRRVREVLQTNPALADDRGRDRAFDITLGQMVFQRVEEVQDTFLFGCVLPVSYLSTGSFQARERVATLGDGTNASLMNAIEERVTWNTETVFSSVRDFIFWRQKVPNNLPAVGVFHSGEQTLREYSSADRLQRKFTARVMTSGLPGARGCSLVCDISEAMFGFLHRYNTWDGTVYDTVCDGISYSVDSSSGIPVYYGDLEFTCLSMEQNVRV